MLEISFIVKTWLMIATRGFKVYFYEIYQRSEFKNKKKGKLNILYILFKFVLKIYLMRDLQLRYIFKKNF